MLALALGRPLGTEDRDCDVELPVAIDDDQLPAYFAGAPLQSDQPALMTGFTALVSLYGIAGRVLRKVYPVNPPGDLPEGERRQQLQCDVDAFDAELTRWLDDLPPAFKANMVNEAQVAMGAVLCSHYYSVLTALHRNMLPVSREQPLSPRSTAKAVSSARACIRLAPFIKNVVAPSHHLAFFIQHLFSCAVIVLLYAMHVTDESAAQAALQEANSCVNAVRSWEGLWPGARKCRELLSELTNTAREAVTNQQADSSRGGPVARDFAQPPAPASAAMPPRERRHSAGSMSMAGKPIRNKLRLSRNMSPDARSRPLHPSAALRLGARSTSRKRGHDETDEILQYRRQLSQTLGRQSQAATALSSPTSANGSVVHSPRMSLIEALPSTTGTRTPPTLVPLSASYSMHASPISPAGLQSPGLHSPANYDLDFATLGGHHNRYGSTGDAWGAYDPNAASAYRSVPGSPGVEAQRTFDQVFGAHTNPVNEPQGSIDPAQLYGGSSANSLYGLAPGASFAVPGLPFHGFDYLRNFDGHDAGPSAGGASEDAHAYNAFDTGAFTYDPFIPFSLESFGEYGNGEHGENGLR